MLRAKKKAFAISFYSPVKRTSPYDTDVSHVERGQSSTCGPDCLRPRSHSPARLLLKAMVEPQSILGGELIHQGKRMYCEGGLGMCR